MNVGLPGTGVGGVFYVLLVTWLPARELWLTLRGRSGPERWRRVATQTALAAGIVGALWGEAWLLGHLPDLLRAAGGSGSTGTAWASAPRTIVRLSPGAGIIR